MNNITGNDSAHYTTEQLPEPPESFTRGIGELDAGQEMDF